MLAGLPRHVNAQLRNIHFICCSNNMPVMDMAAPLAKELSVLELEGLEAFDSYLQQTVLVIAPLLCVLCDNPRASELLNHLGGSARKYCRMCMVRFHVRCLIIMIYECCILYTLCRLTEMETLPDFLLLVVFHQHFRQLLKSRPSRLQPIKQLCAHSMALERIRILC